MTQAEFEKNLKKVGGLLVDKTQEALKENYRHAFGFNKDAYSRGRDPFYRGQSNKIDTGSLYDSVEWVVEKNSEGYVLGLLMNFYWEWVDRGRGPGFGMPIGTLMDWSARKFGISDEKELLGIAIAINKNISKFGIEGTQFFTRTATTSFIDEIADEIENLLNISINEFFEKLEPGNIDAVQVRLF